MGRGWDCPSSLTMSKTKRAWNMMIFMLQSTTSLRLDVFVWMWRSEKVNKLQFERDIWPRERRSSKWHEKGEQSRKSYVLSDRSLVSRRNTWETPSPFISQKRCCKITDKSSLPLRCSVLSSHPLPLACLVFSPRWQAACWETDAAFLPLWKTAFST